MNIDENTIFAVDTCSESVREVLEKCLNESIVNEDNYNVTYNGITYDIYQCDVYGIDVGNIRFYRLVS